MTNKSKCQNEIKSKNLEFNSDEYMNLLGVLDGLGGSFKQYLLVNNMPQKIKCLKHDLDDKSLDIIDKVLYRILHMPDTSKCKYFQIRRKDLWDFFATDNEKRDTKAYYASIEGAQGYKSQFNIGSESYNPDTFFYHHGLSDVNDAVKKYIQQKDFIDAGAYIGDGVLMLQQYAPKKVHCFEISKKTCDRFVETMDLNKVSNSLYKLNQMGISDQEKCVDFNDSGTQGTNVFSNGADKVQLTTIDSYVKKNALEVGFIKSDVEGGGVEALKGMRQTIQDFRPVLSLSMYHNPNEFFELKPYLEDMVKGLDYRIEIKHLHPVPSFLVEVAVFAYPNELV